MSILKYLLRSLAVIFWAGLASAQGVTDQDYARWITVAERAENALEAGRVSANVLDDLRDEVAGWRDVFAEATEANGDRIATLQSQLDQLGAVPESGEENSEIAARRAELTAAISRLQAPVLRAQEAFSRADGLSREIVASLRRAQSRALLTREPTPLNPTEWVSAASELTKASRGIWREITGNWSNETIRSQALDALPASVILILLAAMLLWQGRRQSLRAADYLRARNGRGAIVWSSLISLVQIIVPLLGLTLLVVAAHISGVFGVRGTLLLAHVVNWGFVYLVAHWLADRVFHPDQSVAILSPGPDAAARARRIVNWLAALYVLSLVVENLLNVSDAARDVFPVIECTGNIGRGPIQPSRHGQVLGL